MISVTTALSTLKMRVDSVRTSRFDVRGQGKRGERIGKLGTLDQFGRSCACVEEVSLDERLNAARHKID